MNTKNRCPWANYTLESDGSVKVVNSEVLWWKNERKYATGKAYVNPDLPGTLDVAFGPVQPDPHGDNYIILDTDNTRRVIEFRRKNQSLNVIFCSECLKMTVIQTLLVGILGFGLARISRKVMLKAIDHCFGFWTASISTLMKKSSRK